MKKPETASDNIRIYPSDHKKLKAIADERKADEPGNVTPADVVHSLLEKESPAFTLRTGRK